AIIAALAGMGSARAQGTAFTYQGKLTDGGVPATGLYDLKFRVYDASTGGNQLPQPAPSEVNTNAVPVTNGPFMVILNFDGPGSTVSAVFVGGRRWLEIDARKKDDPAGYVTLAPRAELFPTPYAMYVQNTSSTAADGWKLTGNSGTTPGVNFLGTTD